MTLGFKQQFPWATKDKPAPTYFREKIVAGAGYGPIVSMPKIHTMRADPTNRWRAGRKIEMVYRGAGYKIIDHFNKGIPELEVCVSIQEVKIIWFYKNEYVDTKLPLKTITSLMGTFEYYPAIWVGSRSRQLTEDEIKTLAINDGFAGVEDFFKWFKQDWSGKIIHWTNFRY